MNSNFMNAPTRQSSNDTQPHLEMTNELLMQSQSMPFNQHHLPIANITRIMKESLEDDVGLFVVYFYLLRVDQNFKEC